MNIFIKNNTLISIILAMFFLSLTTITNASGEPRTVIIKEGDEWHYYKGISDPPDKWFYIDFDDSTWLKGSSGFGYGRMEHNTLLDNMRDKYKSVYLRKKFTVLDHNRIKSISLSIKCDGPFVAYLNMIEVIRSKRAGQGEPLTLSGFGHELESGLNVLSIKCSNDNINSDSFSFIPSFELIEE